MPRISAARYGLRTIHEGGPASRSLNPHTAAFREFSAKNLSREKAPSIRRKLEKAQEQSKTQHKEQERGEKVKTRERSVER